jgi:hypothetical protein
MNDVFPRNPGEIGLSEEIVRRGKSRPSRSGPDAGNSLRRSLFSEMAFPSAFAHSGETVSIGTETAPSDHRSFLQEPAVFTAISHAWRVLAIQ